MYVQDRQTYKKIVKQEKAKNRPLSPEVIEFGSRNREMLNKMQTFSCDVCKLYKKHTKNLEVIARCHTRQQKIEKDIEHQRDVFWNKFLAHRAALIDAGYLKDDYPTEQGIMTSQIRNENELYIAEVISSGVLETLTPAQLAAVVCALTTEDLRIDIPFMPVSDKVRKTVNNIRNIKRKVEKIQSRYNLEDAMYINLYFSSLIELWVEGADWETVTGEIDMGEGDIVRSFKRVADVLRQFTTISNVPEALVFTAREAITKILREPVNAD
jgi:superfamily II RNA helicase